MMATKATQYVHDAPVAWKYLNGIFVLYKPAPSSMKKMRETLALHICRDLNAMKVRPPTTHISIEGETNQEMNVLVRPSFADHTLVVGPRYQLQDIRLTTANKLGTHSSGVLVYGINRGNKLISLLKESVPTKCYKVKGRLGEATDNYFSTGKIVEKSTYRHVKRVIIDKICSSMQASHQRKMFELCGVDIQSQAGYELALKGLIRPANKNIPMVYTIKCVDFTPPEFTIEIVCANEYEMYLRTIIHDIGMQLHSTAHCTQIQCYKFGVFDLNHALLSKYWTAECIINNIQKSKEIVKKNPFLLEQENPVLVEPNA